jgi:hypothetical protein
LAAGVVVQVSSEVPAGQDAKLLLAEPLTAVASWRLTAVGVMVLGASGLRVVVSTLACTLAFCVPPPLGERVKVVAVRVTSDEARVDVVGA